MRCSYSIVLGWLAVLLLLHSCTALPTKANVPPPAHPAGVARPSTPAAASHPSPSPPITPPTHVPSLSLPGLSPSESAVRLLLNQESHMAEYAPATIFAIGRFFFYTVVFLLFTLWWMQGSLLYMPTFGRANESKQTHFNTSGFRNPSEYQLPYEEMWIPTKDGHLLHGWLLLQPDPSRAATILFFHGNAGNIGYRLPNAKSLYYTTKSNIFLIDYRGYGNSSGDPHEFGLRMDARAVLHYLRETRPALADISSAASASSSSSAAAAANPAVAPPAIDLARIYVFGRSLGGAVAIHLAWEDQVSRDRKRRSQSLNTTHPPLAGIILENTFINLVEIVLVLASRMGLFPSEPNRTHHQESMARIFRFGFKWMMTNHWDSYALIAEIQTPMLFLSGLADELIPPVHMSGLFESARSSREKKIHAVPHGTHNDTFIKGGMEYYQTIAEFIRTTTESQQDVNRGVLHISEQK